MADDRVAQAGRLGLAQCFDRYVAADPDAPALICDTLDGEHRELSRGALDTMAKAYGASLQAEGVARGDRVVLAVPTSVEFVAAFWGTLLAGAVAVPVPAPDKRGLLEARLAQLDRICEVAQPRLIVASIEALGVDCLGTTRVIEPAALDRAGALTTPLPNAEELAVIQFTSGSTGSPRGCALSHHAVAYNAAAVVKRLGIAPGDTTCCWLPLYHDMGLVSGLAVPVLSDGAVRLRPPTRFLANPLVWLRDLASFSRTHTAAPNFALALVLQRLERRPPDDLDLSVVGNIVCGAEPIDPVLARRFVDALAPYGLPETALHPAYGMAEATLMATSSAGGLRTATFDRASLASDGVAKAATDAGTTLVNLGRPIEGGAVRVVSEARIELREGEVGELEIRLPSLMSGYFRDADATERAFDNGWLRTGDLGFLSGSELFVTGRKKDIVIVAGRNITPADVEYAAARAATIDPTRIGAFGHMGPLGTEDLYIAVETRPNADHAALRATVADACYATCGAFPTAVILVRTGGVPRTTSGKVQRAKLREMMAAGELTDIGAIAA